MVTVQTPNPLESTYTKLRAKATELKTKSDLRAAKALQARSKAVIEAHNDAAASLLSEALSIEREAQRLEDLPLTPIAVAVGPLKAKGIEQAENATRRMIERVLSDLAAKDWDAEAFAPYPSSRMDRTTYKTKHAKYAFVRNITTGDQERRISYRKSGDPEYVVRDDAGVERLVRQARDMAALNYDAYVLKLQAKIGDTTAADLVTYGDLWSDSDLIVTLASGERERWNTKVILNHSVYGLAFNQWPTRKMKSVEGGS